VKGREIRFPDGSLLNKSFKTMRNWDEGYVSFKTFLMAVLKRYSWGTAFERRP
jgi:hypothetical protein